MPTKTIFNMFFAVCAVFVFATMPAFAADEIDNANIADVDALTAQMDDVSVAALENYEVAGSLFQQITDLEQEKVLMQLEKERAQLDLELDRLAAEKIKLHMEIDNLSGRAEQQAAELETEKARLETEAAKLAKERENLEAEVAAPAPVATVPPRRGASADVEIDDDVTARYKLVNVIGAGSQLQATISDLNTGQSKRIAVGRVVDGFTVKSISLDDGVVFVKDGVTQNLNISSVN